jgi:hypothetical protein
LQRLIRDVRNRQASTRELVSQHHPAGC